MNNFKIYYVNADDNSTYKNLVKQIDWNKSWCYDGILYAQDYSLHTIDLDYTVNDLYLELVPTLFRDISKELDIKNEFFGYMLNLIYYFGVDRDTIFLLYPETLLHTDCQRRLLNYLDQIFEDKEIKVLTNSTMIILSGLDTVEKLCIE